LNLPKLRKSTSKPTKWQKFRALFTSCFGRRHQVDESESQIDQLLFECDAILFATTSQDIQI